MRLCDVLGAGEHPSSVYCCLNAPVAAFADAPPVPVPRGGAVCMRPQANHLPGRAPGLCFLARSVCDNAGRRKILFFIAVCVVV